MPKIIDHDARRQEIVESVVDLISRKGMSSVTSRAISAEVGMATGGLWYYFRDLDAVIAAAHELVFRRSNERVAAAVAGSRGMPAMRLMMRVILPVTNEAKIEAGIVVSFWGRVASDSALTATQIGVEAEWEQLLERFVREAIEDETLRADTPVADLVALVVAVALAEQVKWVTRAMFPQQVDPEALLEALFEPYLNDGGDPP